MDFGPLEDLPQLDTLQLDCIRLPILTPSTSCALAALTQLKALRLRHCQILFSDQAQIALDLSALPQLTKLQICDRRQDSDWQIQCLTKLRQVGPDQHTA